MPGSNDPQLFGISQSQPIGGAGIAQGVVSSFLESIQEMETGRWDALSSLAWKPVIKIDTGIDSEERRGEYKRLLLYVFHHKESHLHLLDDKTLQVHCLLLPNTFFLDSSELNFISLPRIYQNLASKFVTTLSQKYQDLT
jgi:hypothetical protein